MRTSSSSSYPYTLGENVRRKQCLGHRYIILFWRRWERETVEGERTRSGQGPSRQSGGAANYRHDPLVLWRYSVSSPKWHPKGRGKNIYTLYNLLHSLYTLIRFVSSLWLDFEIIWSTNVVLYCSILAKFYYPHYYNERKQI